jgi:hypothetical protein
VRPNRAAILSLALVAVFAFVHGGHHRARQRRAQEGSRGILLMKQLKVLPKRRLLAAGPHLLDPDPGDQRRLDSLSALPKAVTAGGVGPEARRAWQQGQSAPQTQGPRAARRTGDWRAPRATGRAAWLAGVVSRRPTSG